MKFMPSQMADGLLETVRALELVEADRLAELESLAERSSGPREVAGFLLKHELLTAFQINQIAQGKGKDLLLGPYLLLERIGAGGMGQVFKARHRKLNRMAAIKVVSPARLSRDNGLQRFLREAEAAAKLSHPNIVMVYDFAAEGAYHYLAMEYVEGMDLSHLLEKTGPLPLPMACDLIYQAALGLHHAHEKGFVHRDVKPSNLLVASKGPRRPEQRHPVEQYYGGTLKILDMGLIRFDSAHEASEGKALTQLGVVIGTLDYLSPEQALNAHDVDRRADVYSLGCTLYHLLAGRAPFPDGLPLDKLLRHQTETAAPLRAVRPEVPAHLENVVVSMLAKHPKNRIQTAAEVAEAMAHFSGRSRPVRIPLAQPVAPENVFAELQATRPTTSVLRDRQSATVELKPQPPSRSVRIREQRARKLTGRHLCLVAAPVVFLGVLCLPILLSKRAHQIAPPSGTKSSTAVDRLARYVPPETAAVLHVQPRPFLAAPIFQPVSKHPALDSGASDLLSVLGIEPCKSVESLRYHFPSGDSDHALWIARGQFEADLFSRDSNVLSAVKSGPDARWGLFRCASGARSYFAGRHDNYLIGSGQAKQVAAAFDYARKDSETVPFDALKKLLDQADSKKHLWLVAAGPLLGNIGSPTGHDATDKMAQTMVSLSESIEASLDCDDSLTLIARIRGKNENSAKRVVDRLKTYRTLAGSLLAKSRANEYDRRLWLQLVHQAKVSRDGVTVAIDSRVTSEMMQ